MSASNRSGDLPDISEWLANYSSFRSIGRSRTAYPLTNTRQSSETATDHSKNTPGNSMEEERRRAPAPTSPKDIIRAFFWALREEALVVAALLVIWTLGWKWLTALAIVILTTFDRFSWKLGKDVILIAIVLLILTLGWKWLNEIAITVSIAISSIAIVKFIISYYRFFWTYKRKIMSVAAPLVLSTLGWKWTIAITLIILNAALLLYTASITFFNWLISAARKAGNKVVEGCGYGFLAGISLIRRDYKEAIEYHSRRLTLAKEIGDRATEGRVYRGLGYDFWMLDDFKTAIDYYNQHLRIVKEMGEKTKERQAYDALQVLFDSLGVAYLIIGDSRKAIECHKSQLSIAKELKAKNKERHAYKNLGHVYYHLRDFRSAIHHYNLQLSVAKEVGDKADEGDAYANLCKAYYRLSDFQRAIDYHNLHLANAKERGDKAEEGRAHGNIGCVNAALCDYKKAIECHSLHLHIAKKVGEMDAEARAYRELGYSFESQGLLPEALENYRCSLTTFNVLRDRFKFEAEWKVDLRNEYKASCSGLWRVLLRQDKIFEALVAAEEGRAQALNDLLESRYGFLTSQSAGAYGQEEISLDELHRYITSSTAFQAVDRGTINVWVLSEGRFVGFRKHELGNSFTLDDATSAYRPLIQAAYKEIGVRVGVQCENRSLHTVRESYIDEMSGWESSQHPLQQVRPLAALYNIAIKPFADLAQGEELIIVPDGPLWLAPYAAFVDSDSKYLCESFRIRLIPSLSNLKMIADCPEGYHCKNGALLVGDPWVAGVTDSSGKKLLEQLAFSKQEVEMIGEILNVTPLIGKKATKAEVLRRLSSVALVHFAAHGRMETGDIALSLDPERVSPIPTKDDYILTMADVLSVKLRARLVVLSCCHSAKGKILDEGVVGIACAFLDAGARSVLVSLWAIDDEATLEFMRSFYHHLVEGKSASKSLNLAMKDLRESDKYSDVKYWAPFVLIGDDVTLEFDEKN
ncbi:uncharacterized protein LOC144647024 [Oculina patagonica]